MSEIIQDKVNQINCLNEEIDSLYHQAALKLGVSDCVLFVLYMLHTKMVYLTEKGKTYTSKTAARLFEAECKALSNWTEEEINLYLKLTERYHADLKNEIESL